MKPKSESSCSGHAWAMVALALSILLLLAAAPMALAQAPTEKKTNAKEGIELPDLVDISLFGGGSWAAKLNKGTVPGTVPGGAAGIRVDGNFWRYLGIEAGYTYSTNNIRMNAPGAPGQALMDWGSRIHRWDLNPILHFTPRGSKVRPYVTAGLSGAKFAPTARGISLAKLPANAVWQATNLQDKFQPMLNYGGGVKWHFMDHVGVRFDVRGLWSRYPAFGLMDSSSGGVWIPHGKFNGLQTTAGLDFYLGKKTVPAPPPPPPPPPPPAPRAIEAGTISGGDGQLCSGESVTLTSNARDPEGKPLAYSWTINGQQYGTGSSLTFTPERGGSHNVELTVSEQGGTRSAKATKTLDVQQYAAPTVTGVTASPAEITVGKTSALSGKGVGSACNGTLNYAWSATEGSVQGGSSANATFDSNGVRFEQSGRMQSKTVPATLTVTDKRGAKASGTANVKVNYIPAAVRFADLIFAKKSARVNNCAKRVLLEELAPKAADMDYDVYLVGHFDADEAPKGKLPKGVKGLDEQRVTNAAAVLTGGTGTCAKLDQGRIKVDWTGTDATAELQPGICGTSARPAAKERKSSAVTTADQKRRVEVWLVPKGQPIPPSVKDGKALDPKTMKKLGCPK